MSSLLTKSKTTLKIYDTSLQFKSKLSDRSWMTLDLLAWLANEISIMMKGCTEEKPQATCDRLPDSPFKLPCIYSRNMEYFTFHQNHYQLSSSYPFDYQPSKTWYQKVHSLYWSPYIYYGTIRRIYCKIKTWYLWWSFPLHSQVMKQFNNNLYSQAKLDLDNVLCWSLKE